MQNWLQHKEMQLQEEKQCSEGCECINCINIPESRDNLHMSSSDESESDTDSDSDIGPQNFSDVSYKEPEDNEVEQLMEWVFGKDF